MENQLQQVKNENGILAQSAQLIANIEQFNTRLNTPPPNDEVQENEFANNSLFLPISFVQMKLDEVYMGLWQTRNFTAKVVANEIVGELELGVFHPIIRDWIWRVGAAAVPIQLRALYELNPDGTRKKDVSGKDIKRPKDLLDAGMKIENTLVKDYPHLYAEALKSAAKTLGAAFGRDLNRKYVDAYTPVYTEEITLDDLKPKIDSAETTDQLEQIWNDHPHLQKLRMFKSMITNKKLKLTTNAK